MMKYAICCKCPTLYFACIINPTLYFANARIRQDGLESVRFDHDMSLQALCILLCLNLFHLKCSGANSFTATMICQEIQDLLYTLAILVAEYSG